MMRGYFKLVLVFGIIFLFLGASVCPSIAGSDKDFEISGKIKYESETLNNKNDRQNILIENSIKGKVILHALKAVETL